ncbi:MAG: hypothetical protein JKY65_06095 [Planctomycetes bacterium]|nr:hypothetical protein [Planctomycetota bacterium]
MSENQPGLGPPESQGSSGVAGRCCGLGCVGILLLGGILAGVLTADASARLDTRLLQIADEVADFKDRAPGPRQTVLGQPANEENAHTDYNGLRWALAGGNLDLLPDRWRREPPKLPVDIKALTAQIAPRGQAVDPEALGYTDFGRPDLKVLMSGIDPDVKTFNSPKGKARYARAVKEDERLKPALRYVRDGLSRGHCDWEVNWEAGMRCEYPDLGYSLYVANLLSYEASQQSPRQAIQTSLEIVAYGQDMSRSGTNLGYVLGIDVCNLGFQSLAYTLGRAGLEASDYQRVIEALRSYAEGVPNPEDALAGTKLQEVLSALALSGRRLDPPSAHDGTGYSSFQVSDSPRFDVAIADDIEGYEKLMQGTIEILQLAPADRPAAQTKLTLEIEGSSYVTAKGLLYGLQGGVKGLVKTHQDTCDLAEAARVLAGAHLLRLDSGSFPSGIGAVSPRLGPEPSDRHTRLGYRLRGGVLECWGLGENGRDDGGGGDDVRLQTRAPAASPRGR